MDTVRLNQAYLPVFRDGTVCARSVNAVAHPENTINEAGLSGLAILEHKLKLSQNHVPISTPGSPVLDNFPAGQVKHIMQGIIVGEAGLVLSVGDVSPVGAREDVRPGLYWAAAQDAAQESRDQRRPALPRLAPPKCQAQDKIFLDSKIGCP